MTKNGHFLKCEAPICIADKTPGWKSKFIWYPGEKICDKKPLSKIQKNQLAINKKIKRKISVNGDRFYTATGLLRKKLEN